MKRLILSLIVVFVTLVAVSCASSGSIWGNHTCQAQKTSNHR